MSFAQRVCRCARAPLPALAACHASAQPSALRASSMVFLYRSIVAKEDPRVAYESVTGVWAPDGPWRQFIQAQLRKHGINFEPL